MNGLVHICRTLKKKKKRREMFYDNLQTHIWMEIGIDHSDNPYIMIKARSEMPLVQKGHA
jgi:hypothetical protein